MSRENVCGRSPKVCLALFFDFFGNDTSPHPSYSGGGGSQRVRLRQSGQLRRTPRREVVEGVAEARAWPVRQST